MKLSIIIILIFPSLLLPAQKEIRIINPEFSKKLESLLSHSVPEISCQELYTCSSEYTILDTRDIEEYNVSHIKDARWVGYSAFNPNTIKSIDKEKPIVCYCSVGYRSEKIAEKLYKAGYTKVYNLYGSIFEWINLDYPVYNISGQRVYNVHTYNKRWSRWMNNPQIKKIY